MNVMLTGLSQVLQYQTMCQPLPNDPAEFPQLWFAKVEQASLQAEEACKSLLSISEYRRFKSIKSPAKQRQFLLSRWLIRHALSKIYKQSLAFWNIEDNGKFPVIHNLPVGTFLSLSHSHDQIVLAISDATIGVDIEKIVHRKNMNELAELFMSVGELALFHQQTNPELYFYQTWCIKEAYFKSLSAVDQQKLSLQKIDSSDICSEKHSGMVIKATLADFMLAIFIAVPTRKRLTALL